jgi:hypothetical protein
MRIGKSFHAIALLLISGIAGLGSAAAGAAPKTAIFVDNSDYVTAYPLGSNGDIAPIAVTTDMIDPGGIARDSSGRIYVSNTSTNKVTIYAADSTGNAPPLAVIGGAKTRLASPTAVALDGSGEIYVLNTGTSSVTKYPSSGNGSGIQNEAPIGRISGPKTQLRDPIAMTVDAAGDVYVANQKGGPTRPVKDYSPGVITIYTAGSNGDVAPVRTIKGKTTGLTDPVGIALDADGDVYVGNNSTYVNRNASYPASIEVFSAGSTDDATPLAVIAGGQTNISYPQGIALDSERNIYATGFTPSGNSTFSSINVYPVGSNGDVAPSTFLGGPDSGLNSDNAIALDEAGNLYVSNSAGGPAGTGMVTEYSTGSVGDALPINTFTSSFTGINGSSGIAVDAGGKIYVANQSDNSIGIYASGTYGSKFPTATIAGDKTGMLNPFSIGLDSIGNIAVLNRDNAITMYPAGSAGDVMPSATIDVGNGGKTSPTAIAVSSRGKLYVASQAVVDCNQRSCFQTGSDNVAIYRPGSDGSTKPSAVISGPDTGLASPSAIAVDRNGNIYVSNEGPPQCMPYCGCIPSGPGSISVYSPGSNGNVKPIATIAGANSEIRFPYGLAVDADDSISVLNDSGFGNFAGQPFRLVPGVWYLPGYLAFGVPPGAPSVPSILIFGAGSTGNAAPMASIRGPFTALEGAGIAVGPAGP